MELTRVLDSNLTQTSHSRRTFDQKKTYRRDIDGLRAIAVTAVVAYHAGLPLFSGGYIGVDIFFVISGYLIGSHVYRDVRRDQFSIAGFYKRRAKRILPALFGVLLFCYVAGIVLLDAPELKTFAEYVVATIGSASNIIIWLKVNYFNAGANQNPLLMTWSLGVEEQFYLFFPLIMLAFARLQRKKLFGVILAATALSLAASAVGVLKYQNPTFYLLPTRAWELACGVLLAIYETDRPAERLYGGGRFANWIGLLGLGLLLYPILQYTDRTTFPGLAALPPVLGSALILMSPGGWVNRYLLSWKPFVFVGLLSYSWYLWHWPLLSFAAIVSDHALPTALSATIALLSLVAAWLSYRFVEQPFRASNMAATRLLRNYGLACVAMVIPAIFLIATHGMPNRYPELSAVEGRSGMNLATNPCVADYGISSPKVSDYCVPAGDEREGIALLGDSHAGSLAAALRPLAQSANLKLYDLNKASCPPLLGVTRRMPDHPGHDEQCAAFNRKVIRLVASDRSIRTVWLAAYWAAPFVEESEGSRYIRDGDRASVSDQDSSSNLAHGLTAMISLLRASGKQVVVVEDDPRFSFDPVRRVRSAFIPARGWLAGEPKSGRGFLGSVPRNEVDIAEYELGSSIIKTAAGSSAEVFDVKKSLCDPKSCYFYNNGRLLYADPQHLSGAGAIQALQDAQIKGSVPAAGGD